VHGYKRCSFKCFQNLEEAKAYLVEGGGDGRGSSQSSMDGLSYSGGSSSSGHGGFGASPFGTVHQTHLTPGASFLVSIIGPLSMTGEGSQRMEGPIEYPFFYVEDMELMLMRACGFFGIGCPVFWPQQCSDGANGIIFRYTIVLPENDQDLALVAYGPSLMDDRKAR
ncbi:hypothetical protein PIB30_090409, partial [Stylosanthes scabra]|nr:hypothetical protein [Stylosanthes scabra]